MKKEAAEKLLRPHHLLSDVICSRLACMRPADEEVFVRHYGAEGSRAFWREFTFGIVSLPKFIYVLARLAAEDINQVEIAEEALKVALLDAYQSDQTFYRGAVDRFASVLRYREIKEPSDIKLLAREAATWLCDNPRWSHLLPNSLDLFLKDKPQAAAPPPSTIIPAGVDRIRNMLRELYAVEAANPPNLADVWRPVAVKLRSEGLTASKTAIQDVASEPEFKARRRQPGQPSGSRRKKQPS